MDTSAVLDLVGDLADNIDDLETTLSPILTSRHSNSATSDSTHSVAAVASKLPLLDKAKLYVLATYAIESLLFSYLRVNGVAAQSHEVFSELARVKEYFGKIAAAEAVGVGGSNRARVDQDAAARFVRHGLAGNERYDRERQAAKASEVAGAKRKLADLEARATVGTHTRFDGAAKRIKAAEEGPSVGVVRAADADSSEEEGNTRQSASSGQTNSKEERRQKKLERRLQRREKERETLAKAGDEPQKQIAEGIVGEPISTAADKAERKKQKKAKKKLRLEEERANEMS